MTYDALIVGGGPAGLAAALTLGRARKRVLLCDAGPRRNAAAVHVQNFVTRDGTPPAEFRRIAREQLAPYPRVEVRDAGVDGLAGAQGAFEARVGGAHVGARRLLLCTGMVDELPDIEGFAELWGTSIFQCPYCHGWEIQDRRFAYLATSAESLHFPPLLRGWSDDVVLLTGGLLELTDEQRATLAAAGVAVETRGIRRLARDGDRLAHVELADGTRLERDALFVHPRQRQVDIVRALGVALDEKGYVRIDETSRETSVAGVYAAGDLTTSLQAAVLAAAQGMRAAAAMNMALTVEDARTRR